MLVDAAAAWLLIKLNSDDTSVPGPAVGAGLPGLILVRPVAPA